MRRGKPVEFNVRKTRAIDDRIINYYDFTKKQEDHNPGYPIHLIKVPFRMIVVAATGGGKSNFLCELIHRMSDTFEEVIICSRCRDEPLYDLLHDEIRGGVTFYENKIPNLDEFKENKKQRLICFDDLILSKSLNSEIGEYFLRSRKYKISCVYLAQSYFEIPKFVRQQTNYVVIKKIQCNKDLKAIVREYSLGMDIDDFTRLHEDITNEDTLGFLMLDLNNAKYRYRHNFVPLRVKNGVVI